MNKRIVTTQAELDRAIADKIDLVEVRSELGVWIDGGDIECRPIELKQTWS